MWMVNNWWFGMSNIQILKNWWCGKCNCNKQRRSCVAGPRDWLHYTLGRPIRVRWACDIKISFSVFREVTQMLCWLCVAWWYGVSSVYIWHGLNNTHTYKHKQTYTRYAILSRILYPSIHGLVRDWLSNHRPVRFVAFCMATTNYLHLSWSAASFCIVQHWMEESIKT